MKPAKARSFLEGALAQGLPSAMNFIAAIWLVWQGSVAEFGTYSLLFAVAGLIAAVQRPLVSLPMNVFATRSHTADHYADFFHFHGISVVVGTLAALAFAAAIGAPVLAFGFFACSQLFREFVKSYLFCTHARREAMQAEAIASLAFLLAMGVAHVSGRISVSSVLVSSAIGATVFAALWLQIRDDVENRRRRRFRWKRYRFIWRYSRWSVAGVGTNEITTRSYNYIVAIFAGYELLGLINFIRQTFSPIQLLSSSWSQICLPVMREYYVAKAQPRILKVRRYAQLGFAGVTATWALALYIGFPWLQQLQPDLNSPLVPLLLLLWCLYFLIDGQIMLYRVELTVQKAFRYLFATELVCAACVVVLSLPTVYLLSEEWLVALTCALNLGLLVVYARRFRGAEGASA